MAVVIIDSHFCTVKAVENAVPPVDGIEEFSYQGSLYALPQKHALVIGEYLIPKQTIISCRETPPGNRTNAIDFIQQSQSLAFGIDLSVPHLFQHPIGKSGCPCPSPGKSHENHMIMVITIPIRGKPIPFFAINFCYGFVMVFVNRRAPRQTCQQH